MADKFLESKIEDGKVTLFVKGGCPYSRNAVDMLRQYNFAPGCLQVFDINESRDAQDYFQATGQSPVSSRSPISEAADPRFVPAAPGAGQLPQGLKRGPFPATPCAGSQGEAAPLSRFSKAPCFHPSAPPVAAATAGLRAAVPGGAARSPPRAPAGRRSCPAAGRCRGAAAPPATVVPPPTPAAAGAGGSAEEARR